MVFGLREVLFIVAVVLAVCAALGVPSGRVSLLAAAVGFIAAGLLVAAV